MQEEPEEQDDRKFCQWQDVDEVDEDGDPHFVDCERPAWFGILRPAQTWDDAQYSCREHLGEFCEFDGMDFQCTVTDLEAQQDNEGAIAAHVAMYGDDDEQPF